MVHKGETRAQLPAGRGSSGGLSGLFRCDWRCVWARYTLCLAKVPLLKMVVGFLRPQDWLSAKQSYSTTESTGNLLKHKSAGIYSRLGSVVQLIIKNGKLLHICESNILGYNPSNKNNIFLKKNERERD